MNISTEKTLVVASPARTRREPVVMGQGPDLNLEDPTATALLNLIERNECVRWLAMGVSMSVATLRGQEARAAMLALIREAEHDARIARMNRRDTVVDHVSPFADTIVTTQTEIVRRSDVVGG